MQFRDIGVLAAVIMIVAMLVIPLPPWLLSFLIIINITLGLNGSSNIHEHAGSITVFYFSDIVTTSNLFRLGLNVSTTRAILVKRRCRWCC